MTFREDLQPMTETEITARRAELTAKLDGIQATVQYRGNTVLMIALLAIIELILSFSSWAAFGLDSPKLLYVITGILVFVSWARLEHSLELRSDARERLLQFDRVDAPTHIIKIASLAKASPSIKRYLEKVKAAGRNYLTCEEYWMLEDGVAQAADANREMFGDASTPA